MAKVLKVNWNEVNKLGKRTFENTKKFEESRARFQEIINSIPNCWEGIDSNHFVNNANLFLESLKSETKYMESWIEFFEKTGHIYRETVNDKAEKIKRDREMFQDPSDRMRI